MDGNSDVVMLSDGSSPEDDLLYAQYVNMRPSGPEPDPEVYYALKGYFTVAEMWRIMLWHRYSLRPPSDPTRDLEFKSLTTRNQESKTGAIWRIKFEDPFFGE